MPADEFRRIANEARLIPHQFGLREFTVWVVTEEYSGDNFDGSIGSERTQLTNFGGSNPKVRELNGEELAVGGYESGTIEVGPITPQYSVGATTAGTSLDTIDPIADLPDKSQRYYLVFGPGYPGDGARFVPAEPPKADRALRYMLTLKRVADGAEQAV